VCVCVCVCVCVKRWEGENKLFLGGCFSAVSSEWNNDREQVHQSQEAREMGRTVGVTEVLRE